MTDLPWMPFWVRDFRGSRNVQRMSMQEVGTYLMLLLEEWENGPLEDDPDALAVIVRSEPNIVRTTLERCFTNVGGRWENERLEGVRAEQVAKLEKFKRAGKASGRARRKAKQGQ